jgi:hypothetical protein
MGIWTLRTVIIACVVVAIAMPSIASSEPLRSEWPQSTSGLHAAMSGGPGDLSRETVRAQNSDDPESAQNRSVREESDESLPAWLPGGPSLAEQRREGAADTEGAFAAYTPASGPFLLVPSSGSRSTASVAWSGRSISDLESTPKNRPVWIAADDISLDARVIEAGIDRRSGEMEIPTAAATTGWYRYGPTPGEPGTTVIAGHFDDEVGLSVFGKLGRLEPGASVEIVLLDGTKVRYAVRETVRYRADELPTDALFRRDGPSTLALVTCTGRFNWSTMRYEETLVVYADLT